MAGDFDRLVEVMGRLRDECLWTQQQTHQSLRRYVIEEAFEVAEAIDLGDSAHLVDELGDLLMQVVFHAAIAESDDEGWTISDVIAAITEKLIHRNPHVFGETSVSSVEEIDANWQRLKAERASSRPARSGGALAELSAQMPALLAAIKVLDRTEGEIVGDDLGSQLLRLVAQARAASLDPEAELRSALVRHAQADAAK